MYGGCKLLLLLYSPSLRIQSTEGSPASGGGCALGSHSTTFSARVMVDSRWRRHRRAALKLFRREVLTGFGLLVGKTVIVCVRARVYAVHNSIVYNAHTYNISLSLSHSLSPAVHRSQPRARGGGIDARRRYRSRRSSGGNTPHSLWFIYCVVTPQRAYISMMVSVCVNVYMCMWGWGDTDGA